MCEGADVVVVNTNVAYTALGICECRCTDCVSGQLLPSSTGHGSWSIANFLLSRPAVKELCSSCWRWTADASGPQLFESFVNPLCMIRFGSLSHHFLDSRCGARPVGMQGRHSDITCDLSSLCAWPFSSNFGLRTAQLRRYDVDFQSP